MTVAVAVWSVVVKPGEPLEIEPPADLRITNVALSDELEDQQARSSLRLIYRSPEAGSDDEDEEDEEEDEEGAAEKVIDTILCSLTPGRIEQATLDLVLEGGVPFALEVTGKNTFHISGNYIDQAGFDQDPSDLGDDSDEEGYNLGDIGSDVEIDAAELDVGDDEDDEARFEEVDGDASSKKRPRDSDAMEDVIDAGEEKLSKAQKKKLNKKLKSADGSAVATGEAAAETPSTTPASAAPSKKEKKKEKKEVAVKEAIREAAKEGAKEGAKEAAKEAAKPKGAEQELAGGLKLRDAKVGAGKTAKKGNTVGMRYIGKLQNGKVFDSNTKGKPFTFNLGKGEVIKGWDEGIVGMAVGGERVLTIPPALAYGKRGAGKDIPPNSTLTFEVKLLEIK